MADSENSRLSGDDRSSADELLWAGVPNIQAGDDVRDTLRPGRVTTKPLLTFNRHPSTAGPHSIQS